LKAAILPLFAGNLHADLGIPSMDEEVVTLMMSPASLTAASFKKGLVSMRHFFFMVTTLSENRLFIKKIGDFIPS
jgi:hypothetical protein